MESTLYQNFTRVGEVSENSLVRWLTRSISDTLPTRVKIPYARAFHEVILINYTAYPYYILSSTIIQPFLYLTRLKKKGRRGELSLGELVSNCECMCWRLQVISMLRVPQSPLPKNTQWSFNASLFVRLFLCRFSNLYKGCVYDVILESKITTGVPKDGR